ncbi:MAG TPA: DUF1761 domain-containing protein [Thermoanaerobaculia bacterium]|nr:DUF1761 domain-containing protein [Thermoanaerobaculia bacterium]
MDGTTPQIAPLAVVAAALSSFVLGGLWYSPLLFGKVWQRLTGLSDEDLKRASPAKIFGLSFLLSLMAAAVFAMFLGPDPKLSFGVGAGLSAGFCWVAASFGINDLFERRPFGLWAINAGYHTLAFLLYGVILAVWP